MTSDPASSGHVVTVRDAAGRPRVFLAVSLATGLLPFVSLSVDAPWRGPASPQTLLAEVIDTRVGSYSRSIAGRKVVFIGGSNLIFGLSPGSLESKLGVPVVNYGLNAGLGADLIARRAMRQVHAGDLVVFAPELAQFRASRPNDPAIRSDWLVRHDEPSDDPAAKFPGRQWVLLREGCRMVRRTSEGWAVDHLMSLVRSDPSSGAGGPIRTPYTPDAYDERGNLNFARPATRAQRFTPAPLEADQYDLHASVGAFALRWLADECRRRGAVLMVMPGLRVENGDETEAERDALTAREEDWLRIAEGLGVPRLLPTGGARFERRFGYDSINHLNDAGVARAEAILEPALRAALGIEAPNGPPP